MAEVGFHFSRAYILNGANFLSNMSSSLNTEGGIWFTQKRIVGRLVLCSTQIQDQQHQHLKQSQHQPVHVFMFIYYYLHGAVFLTFYSITEEMFMYLFMNVYTDILSRLSLVYVWAKHLNYLLVHTSLYFYGDIKFEAAEHQYVNNLGFYLLWCWFWSSVCMWACVGTGVKGSITGVKCDRSTTRCHGYRNPNIAVWRELVIDRSFAVIWTHVSRTGGEKNRACIECMILSCYTVHMSVVI